MVVRSAFALLALLLALVLPAAALAQGAGDEQYSDPFGSEEQHPEQEQAPQATPEPASPPPATTSPSQAAPAPSAPAAPPAAPPASGAEQLPYTGADAGLLALAGAMLLVVGLALRVRLREER